MTVIWHNPRCSKSRQTLALIQEHLPIVRKYLEDVPDIAEIRDMLAKLGVPAAAAVRKSEPIYKELNLKNADQDTIIAAMAADPILIERPIVISNGKAAIGRPPEAVLALFK